MKTVKVAELSGLSLCYAVSMIENPHLVWGITSGIHAHSPVIVIPDMPEPDCYSPYTDWAMCGPIIEREKITIRYTGSLLGFCAHMKTGNGKFTELPPDFVQYANKPLIAAMRCYVASKMGEEVEIPDNLL